MPRQFWPLAALLVVATAAVAGSKLSYPMSKTVEVVEDYHGQSVADPYRWLEEVDSEDTKAWVTAQNDVTFGWLDTIQEREHIRKRLTELWNYPRYGTPRRVAHRYIYSKNDGLQNQSVYYVQESLDREARVLIDPNLLSADGTVSLAEMSISEDGRYMAYSTSTSGSDWREWRVRDIDSGKDLTDYVQWSKFSGAEWAKDGSGFYYSAYDAPKQGDEYEEANYGQKVYFHRLGTPQSEDQLVYARPEQPEWGFGANVSEDGDYLLLHVWQGTDRRNRVFYKDLRATDAKVVELLPELEAEYSFVGNDGSVFYFRTDLDAPRGRLIAIDTERPARENWREVIGELDDVLTGISMLNQQFVATYMHHACDVVRVHERDGRFVRELELPALGSVGGFTGERDHTETFYSFTSFLYPTTIYRYDFAKGESSVFRDAGLDFDPTKYETKQVFYPSKDGTKIPMFLVHSKGLELDGQNPTLLYGYGGFNISMTPSFSPSRLAWLEMGGVYAMANLRGGGEYGEEWHAAGMLHNKQNVFDDFIAAGEWLIRERYTSTPKLAIYGGSNGGLLVGAVLNQRPELFGAAIPAVGVMDMLRFHKFTIGWAWVSDYGSADNPQDFPVLSAYSPYHNIKSGVAYPPVMITTADHDDRVVPGHSFKYAARLQAAQGGDAPILIRVQTKSGHGAGKPVSMQIDEATDMWGFLVKALDIQPKVETDMR